MRLILIRHGEAASVELHPSTTARTSRVLTEHGLNQVRRLADRLRTTGEILDCQALLSSPLTRAWQTAEVLAQALSVNAIEQDPGLCEMASGVPEEVPQETPSLPLDVFDLLSTPFRLFAPAAENWEEFARRVQTTLGRLSAQYAGQTVVAVTHAGFIVASVMVVFAIPRPGTRARLDPDFTSLTAWQVARGRWRLVRYNDTAHLASEEFP